MKYSEAKLGRSFILRLEEGGIYYQKRRNCLIKKNQSRYISSAKVCFFIYY